MSGSEAASEPSMEEILASIRKIIAEESTVPAATPLRYDAGALRGETGRGELLRDVPGRREDWRGESEGDPSEGIDLEFDLPSIFRPAEPQPERALPLRNRLAEAARAGTALFRSSSSNLPADPPLRNEDFPIYPQNSTDQGPTTAPPILLPPPVPMPTAAPVLPPVTKGFAQPSPTIPLSWPIGLTFNPDERPHTQKESATKETTPPVLPISAAHSRRLFANLQDGNSSENLGENLGKSLGNNLSQGAGHLPDGPLPFAKPILGLESGFAEPAVKPAVRSPAPIPETPVATKMGSTRDTALRVPTLGAALSPSSEPVLSRDPPPLKTGTPSNSPFFPADKTSAAKAGSNTDGEEPAEFLMPVLRDWTATPGVFDKIAEAVDQTPLLPAVPPPVPVTEHRQHSVPPPPALSVTPTVAAKETHIPRWVPDAGARHGEDPASGSKTNRYTLSEQEATSVISSTLKAVTSPELSATPSASELTARWDSPRTPPTLSSAQASIFDREKPKVVALPSSPQGQTLSSEWDTEPANGKLVKRDLGILGVASSRTLDETVTELLRPMLREWLDDNMPRIVEQALKVELAESVKKVIKKSSGA